MVPSVNVKFPMVDPDPKVAIPVLSVPVVEGHHLQSLFD